jgi:hypothetical protein
MSHRNTERRAQAALALANKTLPDQRELNDPKVAKAVRILREASLRKRTDREGPSKGELKRKKHEHEDRVWAEWRRGRGLE